MIAIVTTEEEWRVEALRLDVVIRWLVAPQLTLHNHVTV
jgi:hypothetical protein